MGKLIIGLIIGLVVGLVAGYFIANSFNRNPDFIRNNNFQIDENIRQEIISFFENAANISELTSYCQENRMYCAYYCREINANHEICEEIARPRNLG